MKQTLLIFGATILLAVTLGASEYSIRNYRETFCKDKSTVQLQQQYKKVTQESDAMIKHGGEACSNATDTFNTMEAERVGRTLYDDCESYRHGKVRKQIHKNKVVIKAVERELQSRGESPQK